MAINAIRRSVIEFCRETWVWKFLADPLSVQAGNAFYDLECPTGTDITTVMDVSLNNVPLENKPTTWLDEELPGWRTVRKTPKYFTQVDTEQIILAAVPEVNLSNGLTLTLALQPSHTSTAFPKWIFGQYYQTIADGAVAKLMLMPKKPWTDLQNGADRRASFLAGLAGASADAANALGRAPVRSKPQH